MFGTQSDTIETLVFVAEYPCAVSGEYVLQPFADHTVQFADIIGRDTFAIRRIRDEDARLRRFGELLKRQRLQFDVFRQARAPDIFFGFLDGYRRDIRPVAFERKFAFGGVVVVNLVEQVAVEIRPSLKGKALSVDTRGDVQGDHGRFDQQGARSAHGIDEMRLATPSCFQDHTGGKHFVEGRFALCRSITALVKALARTVDGQCAVSV